MKLFDHPIFGILALLVMCGLGLTVGGYLVYIGVWEWLIGGIIQIITAVKMAEISAVMLAIGIAKVIFFEIPIVFGIVAMWLGCYLGVSASK
jgi:uncharacterized membrane protein YcgQ (UPF0703/DUF1980 family)